MVLQIVLARNKPVEIVKFEIFFSLRNALKLLDLTFLFTFYNFEKNSEKSRYYFSYYEHFNSENLNHVQDFHIK